MNLIDLIEADGFTLKRVASTNGGEYAGACPLPGCGGKDRFRVWPETGRYWCRGCNKAGDGIQYLREKRGLSFIEACNVLGRDPGPRKNGTRPAPAPWAPKEAKTPSELWQAKAGAFLDRAVSCLWSRQGDEMRRWLRDRKGLSNKTIRAAGLGYNNENRTFATRASWGIETGIKDDKSKRWLWLPAGLVIPLIGNEQVLRLRIRLNDPGDGPPYVIVSGSSSAPMAWGQGKGAVVIVESELDGLLLNQEAGDLAGVVAIGNAQAKSDAITHGLLTAAAVILVSLDTDDAGAKASWQFWPETYGGKARRWPSINGKDASDARLNGLDLRTWIIAGIFQNEAKFERFCMQTLDGGLTDGEALKAIL